MKSTRYEAFLERPDPGIPHETTRSLPFPLFTNTRMNPLNSKLATFLAAASGLLGTAFGREPEFKKPVPVTEASPWKEFVPVKGQALPVPVQWLQSEQARIAHNLVLPGGLEQIVPFDFKAAERKAFWFGKSAALQYFQHLCDYEAGEWIFEKTEPQEGFFDARPVKVFDESQRRSMYFYESPHYALIFRDGPEVPQRTVGYTKPYRVGANSDPLGHFRFMELPTPRDEAWAKDIKTKYLRHFQEQRFGPHGTWDPWKSTWKIVELDQPTVQYGMTWRGLLRPRDRELRIAGHEQLVYELATGKVIGLRRTFRLVRPPGTEWPGAIQCGRVRVSGTDSEWSTHLIRRVIPSLNEGKLGFQKTVVPSQPYPQPFPREKAQ